MFFQESSLRTLSIQDILVVCPRKDKLPVGEFDCVEINSENSDALIQRVYSYVEILLKRASDKHRETNFDENNQLKNINNITRLVTNEYFFYTQKSFTINQFQSLIEKILPIVLLAPENLHLALGSFAVKNLNNKIMNVVAYITCGQHADIHLVVKSTSSWMDPVYKEIDINGFTSHFVNANIQTDIISDLKITVRGRNYPFSYNNQFLSQTAGGIKFYCLIDICLDHFLGRNKKFLQQEFEMASHIDHDKSEILMFLCSHIIISNTLEISANHTIGEVTQADPIETYLRQSKTEKMYSIDEPPFGPYANIIIKHPKSCVLVGDALMDYYQKKLQHLTSCLHMANTVRTKNSVDRDIPWLTLDLYIQKVKVRINNINSTLDTYFQNPKFDAAASAHSNTKSENSDAFDWGSDPEEMEQDLVVAVQNGNISEVENLLLNIDSKYVLHKKYKNGLTLIFQALISEQAKIIPILAKYGANLHENCLGSTPALMAASLGNIDALKILENLEKFPGELLCAPKKGDGATALFLAAQEGKIDVVRFLLTKGVEPKIACFSETVNHLRNLAENTKQAPIIERMNRIILHNLQDKVSKKVLLNPIDIAFVMGHTSIIQEFIIYSFKQPFDKINGLVVNKKIVCEDLITIIQEVNEQLLLYLQNFRSSKFCIQNYKIFTQSCTTTLEKAKIIFSAIEEDALFQELQMRFNEPFPLQLQDSLVNQRPFFDHPLLLQEERQEDEEKQFGSVEKK